MRIKRSVNALKKRRKTLKLAKGYRGTKSTLYRVAREQVMKSGQYAYVGRRLKKRDFRKLWIARINAAARQNDITYSRLMVIIDIEHILYAFRVRNEICTIAILIYMFCWTQLVYHSKYFVIIWFKTEFT